jgi:hypothetical protein
MPVCQEAQALPLRRHPSARPWCLPQQPPPKCQQRGRGRRRRPRKITGVRGAGGLSLPIRWPGLNLYANYGHLICPRGSLSFVMTKTVNFYRYVVEHGLSLTSKNDSHSTPFKCNNYKSAYLSFAQVQIALKPDIIAQRIFRPPPNVTSSYVHSLGAVPKTESTVRVIHDHSRPVGRSLNDALTQSNFHSVRG